MKQRIVVICPGRGSYTRDCLGSLSPTPAVQAANAYRQSLGRPTPTEMDQAPEYRSALHVAGENASILTASCSLADADVLENSDIVGVVGNSMGWYTALIVAGALPLNDGLRLIETLGYYQHQNVIGGQSVYPLMDADWRPLPSPELEQALKEIPDLYWSIRLGGQAVIGGSSQALAALHQRLPPRKIGDRDAPFSLPLHSAFHTPLLQATAARAHADLADLPWQAPRIPLIDGRGQTFRPRWADPAAIADYTLGTQITEAYDFTTSLRVALREYAPDRLVLLGPGSNLGGAIAQSLITEGWQNIRSRTDFMNRQASDPFLLAMGRPEQRRLLSP